MRTVTTRTTVYKFEELTDAAKESALAHLYDINVDHDWWKCVYDDAKTIGCEIRAFDTGRSNSIDLRCPNAHQTAILIVENHGETCDTMKLADEYLKDFDKLDRGEDGELADEIEKEFARALGEEYLSILRTEYEYQTSEEAIKETIEANDFDFTKEGRIF